MTEHNLHVPTQDHSTLYEQRCQWSELILCLDGRHGEFFMDLEL